MAKTLNVALIVLALAAGSMAAVPTKADEVTVTTTTTSVDPGVVAFGYEDGYWDRTHAWHVWPNHEAAVQYQTKYREHYYGWRHDRDNDKGWHDAWWHN